jgi:hypothetical protein
VLLASPHVPDLPQLTVPADLLWLVDTLRVLTLILGAVVVAVGVRSLFVVDRTVVAYAAYRWRSAALVVGTLYVCLHQFDRLGVPMVTPQFPVGLLFLALAIYSTHRAITQPAVRCDDEAVRRLVEWPGPGKD